jgi:hypothetical protein
MPPPSFHAPPSPNLIRTYGPHFRQLHVHANGAPSLPQVLSVRHSPWPSLLFCLQLAPFSSSGHLQSALLPIALAAHASGMSQPGRPPLPAQAPVWSAQDSWSRYWFKRPLQLHLACFPSFLTFSIVPVWLSTSCLLPFLSDFLVCTCVTVSWLATPVILRQLATAIPTSSSLPSLAWWVHYLCVTYTPVWNYCTTVPTP